MKKRMSILVSAVMGVIATQAEIRWSASGLVGRDGKPWNGEVQLYSRYSSILEEGKLRATARAFNGQVNNAKTDGSYADVYLTSYVFYYKFVDGDRTFKSDNATFSVEEMPGMIFGNLLLSFKDMPSMRTYGGWLIQYGEWAENNGIIGAWESRDANGIHNVFRYAFDKPGDFGGTPLIDIAFNANGKVVIMTPQVKYTTGFTYWVVASSDVAGNDGVAVYPLSEKRQTKISDEELSSARFYRLKAVVDSSD